MFFLYLIKWIWPHNFLGRWSVSRFRKSPSAPSSGSIWSFTIYRWYMCQIVIPMPLPANDVWWKLHHSATFTQLIAQEHFGSFLNRESVRYNTNAFYICQYIHMYVEVRGSFLVWLTTIRDSGKVCMRSRNRCGFFGERNAFSATAVECWIPYTPAVLEVQA
jgi:hypothetical protein